MALEIVWTKRADKKFDAILNYLLTDWGTNVTTNFVRKTHHVVELLSEYPEMGSMEHKKNGIYGFTIVKQINVFYRVSGTQLIVLNFFDNRQNPQVKKY